MFESGVNRKDTQKKRTEKGTHDITEKDTEQPKSSRSKQTSTYPGHSAGLQGWVVGCRFRCCILCAVGRVKVRYLPRLEKAVNSNCG